MSQRNIFQKIILLQTGAPGSSSQLQKLNDQFEQTGDFSLIAKTVDFSLNQQILTNEKGVIGVFQSIASNGFNINFNDDDARQLVQNFIKSGVDTWSKLFAFVIVQIEGDLGKLLENHTEAANQFSDALTRLDKETDYNSDQSINAAKEWLAGIGVSEQTLSLANNNIDALISRFFNGNVQGKVFDGYLQNATVFIDNNANGRLDSGEISTTTDDQGNFLFLGQVPQGQLVSTGGIDSITGLPFNGQLSAVQGASLISPFTTLTNKLITQGFAETLVEAEQIVFQGLAVTPVDLSTFDPFALALDSNSTPLEQQNAIELRASTAQLTNLLSLFNTLFSTFFNNLENNPTAVLFDTVVEALVSAHQNQLTLDLTDATILEQLLSDTTLQLTTNTEVLQSAIAAVAQSLAEINTLIQTATQDNSTQQAFDQIAKLQILTQTELSAALEILGTTNDTSLITTEFSGAELSNNLAQTSLPTDTPPILINSLPQDNQSIFNSDGNITLFFNEIIQAGTGQIIISDGLTDDRIINITDTSQVTFNGTKLIVNPVNDLQSGVSYFISIGEGVIVDTQGNSFVGINNNTSTNSTSSENVQPTPTAPPPPAPVINAPPHAGQ